MNSINFGSAGGTIALVNLVSLKRAMEFTRLIGSKRWREKADVLHPLDWAAAGLGVRGLVWDMPEEDDYIDSPEVDYQRFIAGIVDAIEAADRWNDFKLRTC